jgi:hypothetical protein
MNKVMTNQSQVPLGYDDTPFISGTHYRVHDGTRPQPRVATSGTASTQAEPGRAPADAVLLFDGSDLGGWLALDGGMPRWKVKDGFMEVAPGAGDILSREQFGDAQLHLEWAAPVAVKGSGQGRGNSGVFLMGLYEVQVLDGYDNPTYADGTTGAIYGQYPPLVNASRKPGEWQVYDIMWTAPRFHGQELISPAYLTLLHNGVLVHHHRELLGPTAHRQVLPYTPSPAEGALRLQDHGDLVRFRNIWYRPLHHE